MLLLRRCAAHLFHVGVLGPFRDAAGVLSSPDEVAGDQKDPQAARHQFSQYQGNAYVILYPGNRSPLEFESPASKQNITDQRANKEGGIKFSTPILTLKVFWADPGTNHRF